MLPEYILTNGSFESHFDALGNGRLMARGCFLTSHRPSSDDGIFFFVRDVESKKYWSATPAPTFTRPDSFEIVVGARSARIKRHDGEIETMLDILVPETGDFEIRRLTLRNNGETARRLEVTSSLDIILLYDRLRDSYHQTFSNMFIGAEFAKEYEALLYHRRFFDDPERFPIFAHRIFHEAPAEFLGFETDREAFIGRGRPFGRPLALDRPLRNTEGYILDPLANLRAGVSLAPGASAEIFFAHSAHFAPEQPNTLFKRFPNIDAVRSFFTPEFENDRATQKTIEQDILTLLPCGEAFSELPTGSEKNDFYEFDTKSLLFWNGFGGFDPKTHDYRMHVKKGALPPQPWANILANPMFGTMTTENALGTTWFRNSKHGRLSPWSNNAVTDPPSEAIFLKRAETDEVWSLTPSPLPASNEYIVTHGRGFTKYEGGRGTIHHALTISIDPQKPVKHYGIEIRNDSDQSVEYDVILFLDAPHDHVSDTPPNTPTSTLLPKENALLLDPSYFSPKPTPESVAIHGAILSSEPIRHTSFSKQRVFGIAGVFSKSISLENSDANTPPASPCDAGIILSSKISLAPRETRVAHFALLAGESKESVQNLFPIVQRAWLEQEPITGRAVRAFWERDGNVPSISTPDPSLDILFNTRLPHQTLVSRMWAKMGFYQPGGAYGFRDQLQDAVALFYLDPKIPRDHILAAAREQYEDGNVRAWWSPDSDFGVRNKGSDHPLWLPWATAEYIRLSGDTSILDETTPFFLTPSEEDPTRFDVKRETRTETSATILEHCERAIDFTSALGTHGLPLMRDGDWNDGMNRIGHEGKGESIWLGFFLFSIFEKFANLISDQGNIVLAETYRERAAHLKKNLNEKGWDGHWFLRAFSDDGTALGSEKNAECRIDAIAQGWSVLSGAGDAEKSKEAMENLERFLYDPEMRILKLLDPPFNDLSKKNPGYIKDYPPGIRENGSQYNHAVFWAAEAFAHLGRSDMLSELLLAANPIRRSESERKALLYEVEPYVVAADIYSAEHRGKGGWTWYTASAGLMYRTIIETLFGVFVQNDTITLRPSLPRDWTRASLMLSLHSRLITLVFHAEKSHENTIANILRDGISLGGIPEKIAIPKDTLPHRYDISLM